jgi:hypothetical protein
MVAPWATGTADAGAGAAGPCATPKGLETVAPCEAAGTTLTEGELPGGFDTVPACTAGAEAGAEVAATPCGSPRGFETVAPCEASGFTRAEACVPTGLATVAACAAGAAGFDTVLLAAAGAVVGAMLAAGGAEEAGAATVAVNTFAVIFGEPAALGVKIVGAIVAAACVAVFACSAAGAAGAGVVTGALAVGVPGICPAGATRTLTDDGTLACGAFDVGTVFTANSGLAFGAPVAATVVGG